MTKEQQQVREWMQKFGQETPEKPTIPSLEVRKLRAKLILEEALETCHALNMHPYLKRNHYEDDMLEEDSYGFWEDSKQQVDLSLIADGCEDLKVVTEGTLVACGLVEKEHISYGLDLSPEQEYRDPLFDEVMRSNNSKLWNSEDLEKEYPSGLPEGWTFKIIAEHPEVEGVYAALVKDKDGKIIKPPSYSPPQLQPIIEKMSK